MTFATRIAELIMSARYNFANEVELQDGVEQVLKANGYGVRREVKLDGANRIDLMVGDIGIEVKIASSALQVARQLERYTPFTNELILVTTLAAHRAMPSKIAGSPVTVVFLGEGAL